MTVGQVAVAGASIHLPGGGSVGGIDLPAGLPADRAHELLGRKGLLAKEPATRLALCAVREALGLTGRPPREHLDEHTAVVVSSNLGNVATVASIVRTVRAGSGRDISPLEAPNASSNVIASTIAIWCRFGGPNVTVCSGATSGLQAVALGALLLRSGRASRVVVVGVEPDDEVADALHRRRAAGPTHKLRAVAACVLLESTSDGPVLGPVTRVVHRPELLRIGPDLVLDPPGALGDTYGAAGVLHLALGARAIAGGLGDTARIACGDPVDGWRTVELTGRRR